MRCGKSEIMCFLSIIGDGGVLLVEKNKQRIPSRCVACVDYRFRYDFRASTYSSKALMPAWVIELVVRGRLPDIPFSTVM